MSNTTHMNIQLINSSDFVDPSVINNGFQKLDALGIDYVIESGTSGEWWYRKWKSGRADCGIDSHTFPTSNMNAWLASSLRHQLIKLYSLAYRATRYTAVLASRLGNWRTIWPVSLRPNLSSTRRPLRAASTPKSAKVPTRILGVLYHS